MMPCCWVCRDASEHWTVPTSMFVCVRVILLDMYKERADRHEHASGMWSVPQIHIHAPGLGGIRGGCKDSTWRCKSRGWTQSAERLVPDIWYLMTQLLLSHAYLFGDNCDDLIVIVRIGYYYLCDNGYANSEGFLTPYKGVCYHLKE